MGFSVVVIVAVAVPVLQQHSLALTRVSNCTNTQDIADHLNMGTRIRLCCYTAALSSQDKGTRTIPVHPLGSSYRTSIA